MSQKICQLMQTLRFLQESHVKIVLTKFYTMTPIRQQFGQFSDIYKINLQVSEHLAAFQRFVTRNLLNARKSVLDAGCNQMPPVSVIYYICSITDTFEQGFSFFLLLTRNNHRNLRLLSTIFLLEKKADFIAAIINNSRL